MTVKELIEKLKKYDDKLIVDVSDPGSLMVQLHKRDGENYHRYDTLLDFGE